METPLPYLGNIRSAMAMSGLLLFLAWESVRPFFPFYDQARNRRFAHAGRNLGVGLFNAGLAVACFSHFWGKAAMGSENTGFGLLNRADLPLWLHACAAVLLLDMWTYGWHRANHRIGWLWRFHRMHHSDPWMDVTTARRFHPGEIVLSSILRLPLIALLGIHLWELVLYEALMGIVVDFHHANIAVPERIDRFLRLFLVTPAMHKVHHSRMRQETDANYTSLLSVWDRLFGSFRLRADLHAIHIGLDGWDDDRRQGLRGMLATPMRRRRISS